MNRRSQQHALDSPLREISASLFCKASLIGHAIRTGFQTAIAILRGRPSREFTRGINALARLYGIRSLNEAQKAATLTEQTNQSSPPTISFTFVNRRVAAQTQALELKTTLSDLGFNLDREFSFIHGEVTEHDAPCIHLGNIPHRTSANLIQALRVAHRAGYRVPKNPDTSSIRTPDA